MLEILLFVILPYAAMLLAVVVSIQRYAGRSFTYSSLSSQFLEGGELFYGSVPWHYGILGVLIGHLIGFLFPRQVLLFNGTPVRLYILESTGLMFGLLAVVGLFSLIARRLSTPKIRAVTTPLDLVILLLLLVQVLLGVYTALFYRWGSSWYATSAVPYLRSLFTLQPDVRMLTPLPWIVKLHILNAWLLVLVFPFSRLVHMLIVPISYLWRPYQIVVWNWNRKTRNTRGAVPAREEPAPFPAPATDPAIARRPAVVR